jgi:hypothetical protein
MRKITLLTILFFQFVLFAQGQATNLSPSLADLKTICYPQESNIADYTTITPIEFNNALNNYTPDNLSILPYYKDRGSPGKTILAIGIITTAVGAPVLGVSLMLFLIVRKEDRGDRFYAIAGTGAGLLVAGITLIIVGSTKIYHERFGLVLPKPNEIGIAYSF